MEHSPPYTDSQRAYRTTRPPKPCSAGSPAPPSPPVPPATPCAAADRCSRSVSSRTTTGENDTCSTPGSTSPSSALHRPASHRRKQQAHPCRPVNAASASAAPAAAAPEFQSRQPTLCATKGASSLTVVIHQAAGKILQLHSVRLQRLFTFSAGMACAFFTNCAHATFTVSGNGRIPPYRQCPVR